MAPASSNHSFFALAPAAVPPEDPRLVARNAVHRFLGNPTGQASMMVAELTDGEVEQIVAAAADKQTARQAIKDVMTKAYDRRRTAASEEARQDSERLRRSASARKVLLRETDFNDEQTAEFLGHCTEEEMASLAKLESEQDCFEAVSAIAVAVEQRLAAPPAAETEVDSTDTQLASNETEAPLSETAAASDETTAAVTEQPVSDPATPADEGAASAS